MRRLGRFFGDVWRLAYPYFVSEERWSARALLAANVTMRLVLVGFNIVFSFWNNAFFNSLQEKDWDSFISLLLTWKRVPETPGSFYPAGWILPGFAGFVTVYILLVVYRVYIAQLLQIRWRRWLTGKFLEDWLGDRAYYRISLIAAADAGGARTDNPDQRIAEDLRDFVGDSITGSQGVLFFSVDFLANAVSLVSFLTILWTLSGPLSVLGITIPGYMVWVALLYSGFGTVMTHLVGRKLVPLSFARQRMEADFRFALVRLRENTEGVALSGGEAQEIAGLRRRFSAVMSNWLGLMTRIKYLNALTAGYGQVASIFPIVVAAPRYFFGQMKLGGVMQTAQSFGEVQGAMSWFVDNYSNLAQFRANVERLTSFQRALAAAHEAARAGIATVSGTGPGFALQDATIALPTGEKLMTGADLTLEQGRDVLISGRSGSGKSTLFRTLAGIWPFGSGTVQRPEGMSLFLPQRPYVPLGTLRNALAYPKPPEDFSDEAVRAALEDCGLGHLLEKLDVEEPWPQRLSGGEMQRLSIGRALLTNPDWLFLDEATANLDPEAEQALYLMLKRRLPGCTIISIAHRPAVAAHHDRELRFERPPGRLIDTPAPRDRAA